MGTTNLEVVECKDKTQRAKDVTTVARLLDLKAAASYCSISYWTLRDLALGGEIPIVRFPVPRARDGRTIRRILIDKADLDVFIDRNKERNN
jgi:hypothetical protein